MSEQEKQSGGSAVNTSLIVGENTTDHHKQPYRPTELKEDSEIHHKRPSAPLVPSVDEELKLLTEDTTLSEDAKIKEQMKSIASDKHKQNIARKLSLSTERREQSPESITLASIEVDRKKGPATSLPQIPPDIPSTEEETIEAEKKSAKQFDEDSITEEIAELPNPDVAKEHSEWRYISATSKKLENNKIKFHDDTVAKELPKALDRKASITPCYRGIGANERPSGITICLPTKSNCVYRTSGININISRKYLASRVNITNDKQEENCQTSKHSPDKAQNDTPFTNIRDSIKEKFSNIQAKIKNMFQM